MVEGGFGEPEALGRFTAKGPDPACRSSRTPPESNGVRVFFPAPQDQSDQEQPRRHADEAQPQESCREIIEDPVLRPPAPRGSASACRPGPCFTSGSMHRAEEADWRRGNWATSGWSLKALQWSSRDPRTVLVLRVDEEREELHHLFRASARRRTGPTDLRENGRGLGGMSAAETAKRNRLAGRAGVGSGSPGWGAFSARGTRSPSVRVAKNRRARPLGKDIKGAVAADKPLFTFLPVLRENEDLRVSGPLGSGRLEQREKPRRKRGASGDHLAFRVGNCPDLDRLFQDEGVFRDELCPPPAAAGREGAR